MSVTILQQFYKRYDKILILILGSFGKGLFLLYRRYSFDVRKVYIFFYFMLIINYLTCFVKQHKIQEYGMQHGFTFYALASNTPGTRPISVGDAGSPGHQHRSQIVQRPNAGKYN